MYRNPKILALADGLPCQYCDRRDGTTVAAHSNQGRHGKGTGIKAHDCFVAYLCGPCHTFVDTSMSPIEIRNGVWQIAHLRSVALFSHLLDDEGWPLLTDVQ